MAKHNKEKQEEDIILDVGGSISKAEQFVESYQKEILYAVVGLLVLVAGYMGYNNLYLEPLENEAQEEIWRAQAYFEVDSLDLAIKGDGNYLGFEDIADEYGMTKTGNLANYYLGISYLRKGEYQTAIDYLNDFNSDDKMVGAVALGAAGDAYMELGNQDEALSYYKKAADNSSNDFTTPIYLMKAAMIYEIKGDMDGARSMYERIRDDFPESQEGRSIEKFIAKTK